MIASIGKLLIIFGAVFVTVGLLLMFLDKVPLFGKMPGDIHVKKDGFQLYFPITTSIALSILVSVVLWFATLLGKK